MSGDNACTCEGTRKERMKNWFIIQRNYNLSHFETPKGEPHYSKYSTVMCKKCNMCRRSKADFVYELPDGNI